eukprot:8264309-Alexandrium_andersonii.AAC.1
MWELWGPAAKVPTNQAARGGRVPTFRQLRGDPKVPTQARGGPTRSRQSSVVEHLPTKWADTNEYQRLRLLQLPAPSRE